MNTNYPIIVKSYNLAIFSRFKLRDCERTPSFQSRSLGTRRKSGTKRIYFTLKIFVLPASKIINPLLILEDSNSLLISLISINEY